jgi:hypothetical protein
MAPSLLLGSICSCGRGQVNQERPSRDGHIGNPKSRRVELSQESDSDRWGRSDYLADGCPPCRTLLVT